MHRYPLVAVLCLLGVATLARAQSQYPIPELGNCSDQQSCAAYCDVVENQSACTAYAAANSLDASVEAPVVSVVAPGPGGCTTQADCQVFCDVPENQIACTAFSDTPLPATETPSAETPPTTPSDTTDVVSTSSTTTTPPPTAGTDTVAGDAPATLSADDQKRSEVIVEFGGPDGACNDLTSCRTYCDDPAHDLSCTQYSLTHDLLPRAQAQETITVLTTPGPEGCTGAACEEYCALPGHEAECIEYAKKKGLIDPKEAADQMEVIATATVATPESLEKPGGCKDKSDCRSYCNGAAHKDECDQYALDNGITPQTIGDYLNDPVTPPASAVDPVTAAPAVDTPPPAEPPVQDSPSADTPPQGASIMSILSRITNYLFSR